MRKSVLELVEKTHSPRDEEISTKEFILLKYVVKALKWLGLIYLWGCATGVTAFIILTIYSYFFLKI